MVEKETSNYFKATVERKPEGQHSGAENQFEKTIRVNQINV